MANLTLSAAKELAERASRYEKKQVKEKLSGQHTLEMVSFGLAQTAASPMVGYTVGRLDAKDGVLGNGVRIFGIPIVGLAGVAVGVTGLLVGGAAGAAVAGVGKAAVDGELFLLGLQHGLAAAAKAEEKKA